METSSVSASEAYQEFEKRNNRFVNMLTDNVTYNTHPFKQSLYYRIEIYADKVSKV